VTIESMAWPRVSRRADDLLGLIRIAVKRLTDWLTNAACAGIKRQGQVKSMRLPHGWTTCPAERSTGEDFLREFHPGERDDVRLSFYYRGHRIARGGASDFLAVLGQPEHELSAAEAQSVDLVIRDASEKAWFRIDSIRTDRLNGKRALVVEGVWRKSGLGDLGIFIDADGTGSAVQEIHFLAPIDVYSSYLAVAQGALRSIVWK